MSKNIDLIRKGDYIKVNEHELLDEMSLHINSNIELINTIIDGLKENSSLEGALLVLQRDLSTTNDYIFKYLYDN